MTSASLFGVSNIAYARTVDENGNTGFSEKIMNYMLPKEYASAITTTKTAVTNLSNLVSKITGWIDNLPDTIASMTIHLTSKIYELVATLLVKTPLWLFNNEWFTNTTYLFSMVSISVVSVLTVVESIKLMFSFGKGKMNRRKPMDLLTISKRWFIVAGLTTLVPLVFQKAFQLLNFISEKIINLSAETMNTASITNISGIDIFIMMVFDMILIGTVIPILWKNGRRFFDLLLLAVISPLAMTAWIFNSYRDLFNQWWSQLKHLSLTQVYHSLFLLVLGFFIFGVQTPNTFTGLLFKLLVVIGGFARMINPPRLVARHLDTGGGLDEQIKNNIDDVTKDVKKNYSRISTVFSKTFKFAKKVALKK